MDSSKPFDSIPDDLLIKILSKLPAKSIARCRCVSKGWKSSALMRSGFHRDDFTNLYQTRSKARRRLLIGVKQPQHGEWSFYSTPQPQNPCKKSSLVVSAADFHIKFSRGTSGYECSYASGLIYFHKMCIPREDEDLKHVICNPLTGQYVILPELRGVSHSYSYSYLGFDPVEKEFKVLFMTTRDYIASSGTDHYILTLGTGELRWRRIRCPFTHEPFWERICIDGVLYYSAHVNYDGRRSNVIVCFDVSSETFKLLDPNCRFDNLINYKGKLCGIDLEYGYDGGFPVKLRMRVLEKREWSSYVYSLSADQSEVVKVKENLSVVGVTASGEIVLSTDSASNPFYVFYFNPERNTLQVVEMQGVGDSCDWRYAFVEDYVEDTSVTDAMQLKSALLQLGRSIVPERPKPQQRREEHTIVPERPEPQRRLYAKPQRRDTSLDEEQNIVAERPEPQRRRDTSPDLSKSPQSVKNKEQNGCGSSSANLLFRSVSLAILCFGTLSYVFFVQNKKK
ncbi:PREDICTED: putative F-box protein At1g30930 [Camelina sativa]|uniref:F-box protein At1g30930 n=1 Tax=Camelina sativa TaxID=90675 RepID=A0ABM0WZT6_CAMSA|nr:PREDICTED: putative F-box protein At1g30930 [Camelina sativa]